ncbi:MAG: 4'-phosphopantetheinyl transferase superfamily protein [Deltaproteobacteria bacterium]|nr:4'-phosphopantetheinyl transferase superfamily protein [Deltaproteobacteria bacterium]
MSLSGAAPVRYWVADATEVPVDDEWLTARERELLARFQVRKRIKDWRLGRFTAKQAVASALDEPKLDPRHVEIRPAKSGAPTAWSSGQRLPIEISLSHTGGRAMCTVSPLRRPVGCDLEKIESRARAFERDFFTEGELAWVDRVADEATRAGWVTLVWSAKESVLKALGEGLRLDTRDVEVEPPPVTRLPGTSWERFGAVVARASGAWFGWWRIDGSFASTIATHAPSDPPVRLG